MSRILAPVCGLMFCAVFVANAAPATRMAALPPDTPAQRTYMVFFQTGKASLAPEGREIVRDAAVAAKEMPVPQVRVMVPGEGPNPAALAHSRAQSLKAELMHAGLKASAIAIGGAPQPVGGDDTVLQEWLARRAVIVLSNNQTS